LGRIGFDNVAGHLTDGLASLADRPELNAATERVSPSLAAERVSSGSPLVIDVRTAPERAAKSIPGSVGVPLRQLRDRLKELPRDRPLLVYCAGGYRSSIAASLLAREGFAHVS